jgi:hypothetical protein
VSFGVLFFSKAHRVLKPGKLISDGAFSNRAKNRSYTSENGSSTKYRKKFASYGANYVWNVVSRSLPWLKNRYKPKKEPIDPFRILWASMHATSKRNIKEDIKTRRNASRSCCEMKRERQ